MNTDRLPFPLNRIEKEALRRRVLDSGETLFVQDTVTGGLFYLLCGTIDLKRLTQSGHNILIHRARGDDTFAEASLFSDTYHCTASAAGKSIVIECQRSAILRLLETDISFARAMASRFASQIQETRRRVELLSIRAADERILAAVRDGLLVEDIVTFADTIGLAPETVYRSLAQLSDRGRLF